MLALADDLSGAAETAAVLMSPARPARIALSWPFCGPFPGPLPGPAYGAAPPAPPVLVADLDTRHRPGAAGLVREALACAPGRHVLIKIDSLLRGAVAATAHACLTTPAALAPVPVVLACALPSAGRTVVDGVPLIHGVPLRETRAWHAEPRPAPATVAAALDGVPSADVPLAAVRAGRAALMETLAKTVAGGRVAVCDAETDTDLDTIVAAALAHDLATRLMGAGGLAAALGRALNAAPTSPPAASLPAGPLPLPDGGPHAGALLIVVGTAEPAAAEQARLLAEHGAEHVTLDAADLAAMDQGAVGPDAAGLDAAGLDAVEPGTAAVPRTGAGREPVVGRVRRALAGGIAVLTVRGAAPPSLTAILGRIVREALEGTQTDLVLTGGETARRVLDALGVHELTPLGQVHHGAVHCRTPDGRSVVTRPGSFGGPDSLLRIAAHLRPRHFTTVSGATIEERLK
ncbi:hypothetical protein E1294_12960 [Nonomuraea diastatica]|uniref:Four-carbon acid sugar kinase family protein n=1 Tax=Nonomuraea diastatica TaxID=1848329 RepID=A0A4V2YF68_9ACTN|nr:hypothetical protein E1294_12960 [Nonomuraea diastatica]